MERQVDLNLLNGALGIWADHQRAPRMTTESFVRGCFKKEQPESFINQIIELSLNTPGSVATTIGVNQILYDRDWWSVLEDRDVCVLYISSDRYIEVAEEMKDRIIGAEVQVFQGAGHAIFVDEPDKFNHILSGYLESILNE